MALNVCVRINWLQARWVNLDTPALTKYYYAGGRRVTMRASAVVTYLHADHLGTISASTNAAGALTANARTKPYGCLRADGVPTDYKFTGQRIEATLGPPGCQIYDFGARFYDPVSGRFLSADSIVPGAGNPQSLNRYSYVLNDPLRYRDPSGHCPDCWDFFTGFVIQWGHNIIAPIPGAGAAADSLSVQFDESTASVEGRMAGNIVSSIGAGVEILLGGTETIGGAGACGTVALCFAGAPAMALRTAEMLHGGATSLVASQESGKLANILMARKSYSSLQDAQREINSWGVPENLGHSSASDPEAARKELQGYQYPGYAKGATFARCKVRA